MAWNVRRWLASLTIGVASVGLTSGCGQLVSSPGGGVGEPGVSQLDEAWNASNDPFLLRRDYVVQLPNLPLRGVSQHKPWSDTYWPNQRAGIAQRWNSPDAANSFGYPLYDEFTVRRMSTDQLARLSPAEKYDIFMGRFDYPSVQSERKRSASDQPAWYGLCDGWASASINFFEPLPLVMQGPSGIPVPFGSSDIKGLLARVQQFNGPIRLLGERCDKNISTDPGAADRPECRDVNAGAFHVVLANQLGIGGQPFIAEVSRDYQVWNHPVFAFFSQIVNVQPGRQPTSAPGTVEMVRVQTAVHYIGLITPQWNPVPFRPQAPQISIKNFEYVLELDAAKRIVGGEWMSRERPDFLWKQMPPRWQGYYAHVRSIYEASVRQGQRP